MISPTGGRAVPHGYLPIGERIRHRRRARGLSQLRLAGLVDRTEDWVGKVERGEIPVDRISVLVRVADALKVPLSDLLGEQNWSSDQTAAPQETDGLRRVLSTLPGSFQMGPRDLAELEAYRLAHAFVGAGRLIEAVYVVEAALERAAVAGSSPDLRSLRGALHLPLAVAQARKGDEARAHEALREAEALTHGPDGRFTMAPDLRLATQYGPANVAVHQVSVAVDLGDAGAALALAPRVDRRELSVSRYSRHLIDVALAHTLRRDTPGTVGKLLEVERLAPEQLTHFPLVREMLHAALRRERGPLNAELHGLAERVGAL